VHVAYVRISKLAQYKLVTL